MKLISNWKVVLTQAWSIRLIVIAGILTGLEMLVPMLPEMIGMSNQLYSALIFVVTVAAFIARLIAQLSMQSKA